jgi:hypothetical protein
MEYDRPLGLALALTQVQVQQQVQQQQQVQAHVQQWAHGLVQQEQSLTHV